MSFNEGLQRSNSCETRAIVVYPPHRTPGTRRSISTQIGDISESDTSHCDEANYECKLN